MKKIHFLLAASLLFALAFTLSCSDDKGGWLTCKELETLSMKCYNNHKAEYDACKNDACDEAVGAKIEQCIISDACNGTSMDKCKEHYYKEGCSSDDSNGGGGGDKPSPPPNGDWLTCSQLESRVGLCENRYRAELEACHTDACWDAVEAKLDQCVADEACNGINLEICALYYRNAGCLDDDDEDGGSDEPNPPSNGEWLTCSEFYMLDDSCYDRYEAEYACNYNDDACWDIVDAKWQECLMGGACNGTSESICWNHYYQECY